MNNGLVSVVMAVHNECESFLRTSIGSILSQTYPYIELIIVDDASDQECRDNLNEIVRDSEKVTILHNETNLGLTKSLNIGIDAANGEFIARMDADDFSVPERLSKQVAFFVAHPEIDIVGTGVVSFGDKSVFMSPAFGFDNGEAQCMLFFSSTLCHPSVMIQKSFLDVHSLRYDETVKKGQDYDLWERASVYGELAVMREVLLYYRSHSKQITSASSAEQTYYADIVRRRRLQRIGIVPTEKESQCHALLASGHSCELSVSELEQWIEKILSGNKKRSLVDESLLRQHLYSRLILAKLRNQKWWRNIKGSEITGCLMLLANRIAMYLKLFRCRKTIKKYNLI